MSILIAVIALGILIFVHELGHFLVAKRCGIKVERFSLGFGKALISRQWGETEYVLAAIPLGGYVKMHGDVPEEWMDKPGLSPENMGRGADEDEDAEPPEPIDPERSYLHKPIPQRIAVAVAGPAFNLIFGYFAILLFLWVEPHPAPVVGSLEENSPAAMAGIQSGDTILSVDGKEVRFFEDIVEGVRASTGEKVLVEFERNGQTMSAEIPHESVEGMNEFGESVQVNSIGAHPPIGTKIAMVKPGSPADKAGIQGGDEIIALNGKPVSFWSQVSDTVKSGGGAPLSVRVSRKGEPLELTMTPELTEMEVDGEKISRPMIGVQSAQNFTQTRHAGLAYAFANAPSETLRLMIMIPMGLYKLIVGDVPRDQVGGPIEIGAQMASAVDQGFGKFMFLMALISINLGILNLLPIPVLDGGHIVFFLVEALNRKPISLRTREIAQQVGLSLLLLLMLFAFYNDIRRRVLPGVLEFFNN